ncbi:MAG TPA: amidohydrolase family protein [Armatimonadota bacterium]|nr:amidohydrolase family protein [Armatimonadota bacterium]
MPIIDAHIHLGANQHTKYYPYEQMRSDLDEAGADGAVVFAFPEDIYRITDTPEARVAANEAVLAAGRLHEHVYPFYFVWGDYILPENLADYVGVKWHRHDDEPEYSYTDAACEEFIRAIAKLNMPVTLEEELEYTEDFIERAADTGLAVIIPHMGMLNGGHGAMSDFFPYDHVYFDTSCAPLEAIDRILNAVGPERVLYGSDVSGTSEPFFNFPRVEREKLDQLGLSESEHQLVFGANILRLIARTPAGKRMLGDT